MSKFRDGRNNGMVSSVLDMVALRFLAFTSSLDVSLDEKGGKRSLRSGWG